MKTTIATNHVLIEIARDDTAAEIVKGLIEALKTELRVKDLRDLKTHISDIPSRYRAVVLKLRGFKLTDEFADRLAEEFERLFTEYMVLGYLTGREKKVKVIGAFASNGVGGTILGTKRLVKSLAGNRPVGIEKIHEWAEGLEPDYSMDAFVG
jgi:hypothetical protein